MRRWRALQLVGATCILLGCVSLPTLATRRGAASSDGLHVTFGAEGLEQVSYAGQTVADTRRWPEDALHIWHMKCTDAQGKIVQGDGYGWGETGRTRSWDAATHTATYQWPWGSLRLHYTVAGDALLIEVAVSNRQGSGVLFDGATLYPLTLHLAGASSGTAIVDNVEQPGVTSTRWRSGAVAVIALGGRRPLYSGFQAGKDGALSAIASGTRPDALPASAHELERPVRPGETDRFTLSIRFALAELPAQTLAQDADREFAERWPKTLAWKDHRAIGTVFLASSPAGDKTQPGGYPANPRRYFNDSHVDVKTAAGLRSFQERVLTQADQIVANLRRVNAQGAITWDIEGEQFPQDTSYVCAPDQIATLAPEMESLVTVPGSPYAGMKLDDAYFKTIRDAGFRVGLCVRPQRFTTKADHTARQVALPDSEVSAELIRKMRYAHDRWGATLFYLDSTVRADGSTLGAAEIEQAAMALPDSLLMPEEASLRMYRATAPFLTFLFHGDVATAARVHAVYPQAFSVNMINDVEAARLDRQRAALTGAVRAGDILLIHADTWHPNNAVVAEIYRSAASAAQR